MAVDTYIQQAQSHIRTEQETIDEMLDAYTVREELTDAIAVALEPTTEASFTPELKRMVLDEAQSRRSEATALQKALEREEAYLDDSDDAVDEIIAWIVDANETPLIDLRFDALQQRHETLSDHCDRCVEVARDRQEFLQETTNNGLDVGVRHRSLMPYQYQDFSIDHPVLATVAKLDETCQECQRAVRGHLARRARPMVGGSRRRRKRAWAWVYAALFAPEGCSVPDADEECAEESTNSAISRDQSDGR